jgi:CHASE2 domain-containing sensor protein
VPARESFRSWLPRLVRSLVARLISHIRPHQDDAIVCVLKIVREFVSRLIQLDVIRAGHEHHDDAAVLELLDRTSELRSFRPQLADGPIDVVALNAIEW